MLSVSLPSRMRKGVYVLPVAILGRVEGRLKGFLAEKRRGDAAERLQNGWYRCVTGKLRAESCESRWAKA